MISFAQNFSMNRILLFFLSLAIVLSACNGRDQKVSEQQTKTLNLLPSRHSAAFNKSVDSVMNAYYALTDAFVNWDSVGVASKAKVLEKTIHSFLLQKFQEDSAITKPVSASLDSITNNLASIKNEKGITKERHELNLLTQNLYVFLRTIKYDEKKLYLQQCPMAFNDEEPGVWLSSVSSIRNPYMGLHHPRYGGAMIDCGETKATINFTSKAN